MLFAHIWRDHSPCTNVLPVIFRFYIGLEASKEQVLHGVKRREQEYPEDVDRSLGDELTTFHLYVKQSYAEKGSFYHQQL